MKAERTYRFGKNTIVFQESKEIASQCSRFDEPYHLAIDIYVLEEGEILHRYFRHFEKEVHMIHYHNFIKKFLREPFYRIQYLAEGENNWEGVLDLDAYKKPNSRYA